MLALTAWSPFSALRELDRELDRMFAHAFEASAPSPWLPPVEWYNRDGCLVVRADLPGVDPKDVEVTLQGDQLTIKGERKASWAPEDGARYREVRYGVFARTMTVPEGIARDQVRAAFTNGVLEVTLPLPSELAPHRIPIAIEGHQAKAIQA